MPANGAANIHNGNVPANGNNSPIPQKPKPSSTKPTKKYSIKKLFSNADLNPLRTNYSCPPMI